MKIVADDMSSPLRYELDDGREIGQFYMAADGKLHLAEYVPYVSPPSITLCGRGASVWAASRAQDPERRCGGCYNLLQAIAGVDL